MDTRLYLGYLPHFVHNMNFPSKSQAVTFAFHLFKPFIMHHFRKNLMIILREKLKCVNFGPKNDSFPPFWA